MIRGSTPHFDYVAAGAATGIARASQDTGVPVIFGVLTTDTLEQALERAGSKMGNKGYDAAFAAVEMANLMRAIAESEPRLSRWKLEHIARLRNAYVHAGGTGDDLHDLCLFLRSLLARHIHYWIMEGQQLASHTELLNFAKLPPDRAELVAMRDTIDRRLAFMNLAGGEEDD